MREGGRRQSQGGVPSHLLVRSLAHVELHGDMCRVSSEPGSPETDRSEQRMCLANSIVDCWLSPYGAVPRPLSGRSFRTRPRHPHTVAKAVGLGFVLPKYAALERGQSTQTERLVRRQEGQIRDRRLPRGSKPPGSCGHASVQSRYRTPLLVPRIPLQVSTMSYMQHAQLNQATAPA